jgi:16S rRNA (cytidine1402-2'-O)-methyltransferase
VRALALVASEPRTMVFFEAPSRLAETLHAMAAAFGADRPAAVCRELTKLHEEVVRDGLAALAEWAQAGVRGEIVVVVGGAPAREVSAEDAVAQVQALVADGIRLKDASAEVAAATGLSSRDLYQAVLASR